MECVYEREGRGAVEASLSAAGLLSDSYSPAGEVTRVSLIRTIAKTKDALCFHELFMKQD